MHTTADVLADPHVEAMGYLQRVRYPGAPKPVPLIETPFRMSATPGTIRHRAPQLGEHTAEILAGLGYSAADVTGLREREIV
jgi:crotonobetainyl-CoA:carnitine CoA-transferase CaiB-like acyl-CoA transferase